jgi:hypothetical protein
VAETLCATYVTNNAGKKHNWLDASKTGASSSGGILEKAF